VDGVSSIRHMTQEEKEVKKDSFKPIGKRKQGKICSYD